MTAFVGMAAPHEAFPSDADVVETVKDTYRSTNPMQRVGTSEEVSAAVAYLAFSTTFSTGTEFPVDGGLRNSRCPDRT
ncbi:hypothetical protein GCM10017744_003510 [Streptomyces antimycoticus]|uniref:SDR family oxidoreductase n=1 Tax=Streptomyces antimycoticus TaxID=68175 RepID=A0A4D4KJP8_9ACTN|nr:hypothetical protein SANT12839_096140 [Streptomyces antimycoticus]